MCHTFSMIPPPPRTYSPNFSSFGLSWAERDFRGGGLKHARQNSISAQETSNELKFGDVETRMEKL